MYAVAVVVPQSWMRMAEASPELLPPSCRQPTLLNRDIEVGSYWLPFVNITALSSLNSDAYCFSDSQGYGF